MVQLFHSNDFGLL
jgi:hypothetical protein